MSDYWKNYLKEIREKKHLLASKNNVQRKKKKIKVHLTYKTATKLRNTPAYQRLRASVILKSGGSCKQCGVKTVNLFAHHIVPVYENPSKIMKQKNMIAVCGPCHEMFHPWLKRPNAKQQQDCDNLDDTYRQMFR
jgi:5-methylcytosine-specific restriction endonuclease McrA